MYRISKEAFLRAVQNNTELTAIIKPTTRCNLACTYCSVWEKNNLRMPLELMEKILNETTRYMERNLGEQSSLLAVFHGGEPLLMGHKYYEDTFKILNGLRDKGYNIQPHFQTNATLIDKKYIEIFRNNGCDISISLDGPEKIHDAQRHTRNNHGSYKSVINGLTLLQEANINPWVCAVIRKDSIENIIDIYEHMKELKIQNLFFGFLYPSGDGRNVQNELGIEEDIWTKNLIKLYEYWLDDTTRIPNIEPINRVIFNLEGKKNIGCNASRCISRVVGFMPDGGVYPCAVLTGLDEFNYGNINNDNLENILNCQVRTNLLTRHNKLDNKCRACDFVSFCKGNCMHLSYTINKNAESLGAFCEKELFSYIEKTLLERDIFCLVDKKSIIRRREKNQQFVLSLPPISKAILPKYRLKVI